MHNGKATPSRPPPAKIRKLSAPPAAPPLENPTSPTSTHRSSFSSSPERDPAARAAAAATTPKRTPKSPFRSLRTRLRSFGLGSSSPSAAAATASTSSRRRPASLGGGGGKDGWSGTTTATRQSVRGKTVSGPVSVIPGGAARLKGYQGPAGSRPNAALTAAAAEAAAGTVGRSVSLPANLAARATGGGGGGGGGDDDGADFDEQRRRVDEVLPALLWRARSGKSQGGTEYGSGRVTEFGAILGGAVSPLSVDEFLAAQMPLHSPPPVSPNHSTSDVDAQRPLPSRDRSPKPGLRSIQIPPRNDPSFSPNPPSSIARFLRSPTPEQQHGEAENPSSNPRPPLMPPRISSDFIRHSAGPSLSALRARQVAETEAIARDLAARDPTHRNSRILPGATLPIDWATQTLVRSKTMGAVVAVPDRWRDPYVVEGNSNGSGDGGRKGSSSQGSSSLRRSSSDSPLLPQSDVMRDAIAVAGGRQGENERGFSLGRVAGRRRQPAMISYKTHGRTASVPTTRNERAAEGQHPDSEDSPFFKQPFPSEFEEVPFRRAANFRPSSSAADEETNLPMSPSTPATPLMPQIVEASPPPSTAPGSPDPGSSKPSSNAADENGKSPLMDMIEQLQAHPTSRNGVSAPFRGGGAFLGPSAGRHMFAREYAAAAAEDPEDAMENLDDSPYEEEYHHRDRNTSNQSEGGYPFPLAGYLESAAPSRSASTDAGQVHPGPPAYLAKLPSRAGLPAPIARSPPPPTSPTPNSDRDDGFFLRSPLGASSGSAFVRASFDSPDRSITMEQMEREIAQMEAELAASGTPRSLYDSPYLSSIRSPAVGDDEPESPSPPGSNRITPRSAKRWSLIEMERAYERMKNLLASSNERQRSRSHDERAFGLDSVPEVLAAQDSPFMAARTDGGASREGERPDQASFSPKPSALRERRLADQRDYGVVPLGESGGPLTVVANKPLPGLPAPSPRKPVPPYNVAKPSGLSVPLSDADHASLSGPERAVEAPAAEALSRAAAPEGKSDAADLPEPEASTSPTRAAAAEPAPEQRGNLSNLAHRRTGSESRIRQLYLPLRHKSTRDSMLSVAGIDDMLSELGSPVTEVAPKRSSGHSETTTTTTTTPPPPLSPSHEQRLPTSARSSRFARYELRSGAGRELQRRLGHENNAPSPVEPLSPMRRQDPAVRRVSSRLSSSRLQRAAGELSAEEGNRRTGEGSNDGGVTTTWYPISPGRDRPLQLASDGSESNGTVSTGYDNGRRRRRSSSEKPRGVPARPALSVARVRTMDKLELYLEYVAIRSDLEKAELERAAVFDALRETRAVLADVRRQRDAAERELQVVRTAGPPDASPTDSTHAWRERAQQALRDVEILRHELLESRAREKEALARGGGGGGGGGETSSVSPPPPPVRATRSFVVSPSSSHSSSELSTAGARTTTTTVTMQQGPFPSASGETQAHNHHDAASSERVLRSPPLSVDNDPARAAPRDSKDSFASSSLDSQFTTTTTSSDAPTTDNNVDGSSSSNGGARNRLSALSLFHGSDFVSPLMNQTMNFIVGGLGSSGGGRRDSVVDLAREEEREGTKSSFGSGTGTGTSASAVSSPLKGRFSATAGFSGEAAATTRTATTLMGRSLSALGFPGHGLATATTATAEEDAAARAGAKMSTSTVGTTTTTTTTTTTSSGIGNGGEDWSLESTTLVNPNPEDDHEEGGLLQDPAGRRRRQRRRQGGKNWLRSRDEAFLADLTTAPSLGLGSAVDVDHDRGQEEGED